MIGKYERPEVRSTGPGDEPPRLEGPGTAGRALAAVVLLAALWPAAATAQRFTVELRAGASVGNYTETAAGLDFLPALSYAAVLETGLTRTFAGYAAFTRSSFGCEEGFCTGRNVSLSSQGLTVGARWSPGLPWVRAGLALRSLHVTADNQAETSELGIGWELAAGLELPVAGRFRIRPGLTYLRHHTATDQGDGHVALLALEMGVAIRLGG